MGEESSGATWPIRAGYEIASQDLYYGGGDRVEERGDGSPSLGLVANLSGSSHKWRIATGHLGLTREADMRLTG